MEVFRYCCPFQNNLQYELTSIIKVNKSIEILLESISFQTGTMEWFDRMVTEITKPRLRVKFCFDDEEKKQNLFSISPMKKY
jgi:hypothetical protein